MGLFQNLFGKATRGKRLDDVVWLNEGARTRGILAAARQRLADGERVAVGAWNAAQLQSLRDAGGAPPVDLLEPHQLNPGRIGELGRGASRVVLLLAGAPPTSDGEARLLAQCATLPCEVELQLHHSLDDRVLSIFIQPRIRDMLKALGMGNDEPITHRWVTRAIETARRKSGPVAK